MLSNFSFVCVLKLPGNVISLAGFGRESITISFSFPLEERQEDKLIERKPANKTNAENFLQSIVMFSG